MKKKRLYESNIFKYDFSGDRYVDWVLSYWFDWYSDSAGLDVDLTDEQVYEMFVNQGFDKLAEIIFEEFPICATTPHCDFDAEYCWKKFLDTREGRKAEEWLEDNVTKSLFHCSEESPEGSIAEIRGFLFSCLSLSS